MSVDRPGWQRVAAQDVARFRRGLLAWSRVNGRDFPWRKPSGSTYVRIVAELLLQRTRAETVAAMFPAFVGEFSSWRRLSRASYWQLRRHLTRLGLWRRRIPTLRGLARAVAALHGRFPREREAVEALPGVGQYVANAVFLFAHGLSSPLLDVNMARVLERYFGPRELVDIRYDPYLQKLASTIVRVRRAIAVNWAILDLAAMVCVSGQPRCHRCPLAHSCRFARNARRATGSRI
jgi:A/G-specific adenine glycosylase